jgi:hypothetical protein
LPLHPLPYRICFDCRIIALCALLPRPAALASKSSNETKPKRTAHSLGLPSPTKPPHPERLGTATASTCLALISRELCRFTNEKPSGSSDGQVIQDLPRRRFCHNVVVCSIAFMEWACGMDGEGKGWLLYLQRVFLSKLRRRK